MNTKYRSAFYAFALLAATFTGTAASSAKQVLTNPETGVVCDKYLCADKDGISNDLTIKYLGKDVANALFSQGEFSLTEFTFGNGVFCDTKVKSCYVDRYFNGDGKRSAVEPKTTVLLFGE